MDKTNTDQPSKPVITYTYRGQVERGTATERNPRPGYRWHNGYSEEPNVQPWMTYRECQADAKARGAVARFVEVQESHECNHPIAALLASHDGGTVVCMDCRAEVPA